MKKLSAVIVLLISAFVVNAQEAKKEEAKKEEWAELSAFHKVMSSTFHPSEEGDLKPIKERSGELYEKAEALYRSTPPEKYNKPEIKQATATLRDRAEKLNFDMKKGKLSDDEIKKNLAEVHDAFHMIVEKCRPGSESKEAGESHEGHKH